MKPPGRLRRRTRLRRGKPLRRGRLRSHRRRGYGKAWRWAMERAGWRCEVVDPDTNERCYSTRVEAHHMLPRSRGGGDDLGNLLVTCRAHHRLIHENWDGWATRAGYLRSQYRRVS